MSTFCHDGIAASMCIQTNRARVFATRLELFRVDGDNIDSEMRLNFANNIRKRPDTRILTNHPLDLPHNTSCVRVVDFSALIAHISHEFNDCVEPTCGAVRFIDAHAPLDLRENSSHVVRVHYVALVT